MRAEQKSNVKNSIGRLGVTGISIIIQVLWIIFLFIRLNRYSTAISLFSSILALIVVLHIYGRRSNAAFKMPCSQLRDCVSTAFLEMPILQGKCGINLQSWTGNWSL